MNAKPSDFFLNVIEFFGVLIPGWLIYSLHPDLFLPVSGLQSSAPQSARDWIIAFCISYIAGQILFVISEPLYKIIGFEKNRKDLFYKLVLTRFKYSDTTKKYLDKVRSSGQLPEFMNSEKKYIDIFYFVFNYVCIHSSNAVAELERQASKYKLFRSLTLVFLTELIISIVYSVINLEINGSLWIWLTGFCLSVVLFIQLFDWTFQLSLIYYHHLTNKKNSD